MSTFRRVWSACFFLTVGVSTSSVASAISCNGDCYGVAASVYVASGSNYQSKAVNNGLTNLAAIAHYNVPGHEVYSGPNSARAAANLSQGAVRAGVNAFAGGGVANSSWFEQVQFLLPNGLKSIDVPISWTIEGSNKIQSFLPSDDVSSQQSIDAYFRIFAFENGHDSLNYEIRNCQTSILCDVGPVSQTFSGNFKVEPNVLYEVDMGIYLTGQNVVKNFNNTSFVHFDLPQGVDLQSSSGVFLTNPVSSIPEPSTWTIFIVGIGLLGSVLRRANSWPSAKSSLN